MADETYSRLDLPVKTEKGDEGALTSCFWGAELRGGEGTLGSPLGKRIDLVGITLEAVRLPVSKAMFHQLLGSWVYVIGFRKELLFVIESSYSYLNEMPEGGRIMLPGRVVDELLVLSFLAPMMHVHLKDEPVPYNNIFSKGSGTMETANSHARGRTDAIFATDAAGDGGLGGCVAPLSRVDWKRCCSCSESYGEYTRLNFAEGPELRNTVVDKRAVAAHLVTRLDWKESIGF